jgi:hypothetical protein
MADSRKVSHYLQIFKFFGQSIAIIFLPHAWDIKYAYDVNTSYCKVHRSLTFTSECFTVFIKICTLMYLTVSIPVHEMLMDWPSQSFITPYPSYCYSWSKQFYILQISWLIYHFLWNFVCPCFGYSFKNM